MECKREKQVGELWSVRLEEGGWLGPYTGQSGDQGLNVSSATVTFKQVMHEISPRLLICKLGFIVVPTPDCCPSCMMALIVTIFAGLEKR